jgi:hypothetical protein
MPAVISAWPSWVEQVARKGAGVRKGMIVNPCSGLQHRRHRYVFMARILPVGALIQFFAQKPKSEWVVLGLRAPQLLSLL